MLFATQFCLNKPKVNHCINVHLQISTFQIVVYRIISKLGNIEKDTQVCGYNKWKSNQIRGWKQMKNDVKKEEDEQVVNGRLINCQQTTTTRKWKQNFSKLEKLTLLIKCKNRSKIKTLRIRNDSLEVIMAGLGRA